MMRLATTRKATQQLALKALATLRLAQIKGATLQPVLIAKATMLNVQARKDLQALRLTQKGTTRITQAALVTTLLIQGQTVMQHG